MEQLPVDMEQYRSIIDVTKAMLEIIPKEEEKLINELKTYISSLWNQAPEALLEKYNWVPVHIILYNNIPNIDNEWKIKVKKIFNNQN
jgi:hypothetical protein